MPSLVSIQVDLSHKIGEVLNESLNPYGKIFLHRIVIFAERIIPVEFPLLPNYFWWSNHRGWKHNRCWTHDKRLIAIKFLLLGKCFWPDNHGCWKLNRCGIHDKMCAAAALKHMMTLLQTWSLCQIACNSWVPGCFWCFTIFSMTELFEVCVHFVGLLCQMQRRWTLKLVDMLTLYYCVLSQWWWHTFYMQYTSEQGTLLTRANWLWFFFIVLLYWGQLESHWFTKPFDPFLERCRWMGSHSLRRMNFCQWWCARSSCWTYPILHLVYTCIPMTATVELINPKILQEIVV